MTKSTPWTTVVIFVVVIGAVVVLALRGPELTENAVTIIIASLLNLIPATAALRKVENVQHDMRNGVMTQQTKDGVREVMNEMAEPVSNSDGETVAMIVTPSYTGPERRQP